MTRSTHPSGVRSRQAPKPVPRRTPVLLLSVAAVAIGLIVVVVLAVAGGLPGATSSSALATPIADTPAALADGRSLGVADAPITIDLWADFQCPVCARFARDIEPLLVSRYVQPGLVRLTFRDFAFIGPESFDAAVAARVAGALGGKFWAYHDLLFANQGAENSGSFSRARLADMAVAVGLDRTAFLAALDDPSYLAAVRQEAAQGQALGVNSTPTMSINGKLAAGLPDWTALESYLDSLLAVSSGVPLSSASNAP